MLSLLSITAQLSFHASVTDHFYHLSKIISQFIPVDWTPPTGVLARVTQRAYRPSTGSGPVASKYYCEFLWTVKSIYQIKCNQVIDQLSLWLHNCSIISAHGSRSHACSHGLGQKLIWLKVKWAFHSPQIFFVVLSFWEKCCFKYLFKLKSSLFL